MSCTEGEMDWRLGELMSRRETFRQSQASCCPSLKKASVAFAQLDAEAQEPPFLARFSAVWRGGAHRQTRYFVRKDAPIGEP